MNIPNWPFLHNPFANATANSYIRALIIGGYTDAALGAAAAGNPAIAALYAAYHPLYVGYSQRFANWVQQSGAQKGQTQSLVDLLAESTAKVDRWDRKVQDAIAKGSPAYTAIFPKGREAYNSGGQDSRIEAIEALGIALGAAGLPLLQAEVVAYYDSLTATKNTQKGAISTTKIKSGDVETARIAMCDGLYAALGGLMQMNATDPHKSAPFFKLSLIQQKAQKVFTGHTDPGQTEAVAKRTLAPTDELSLMNAGAGPLTFFMAATADAPLPPGGGTTVQPGQEQTVTAAELGSSEEAHFIVVHNPGPAVGVWEVDV